MKWLLIMMLSLVLWVGVAPAQCLTCLDAPYSIWFDRPLPSGQHESGTSVYSDSLGNTGVISKSGQIYNVLPGPRMQFRGGMDLGAEADRLTDFLNNQYQMDHGVTPWGTVSKDPWGFRFKDRSGR